MDIKPADLILVRGKGFLQDAIQVFTHSPYSHLAGVVKTNELVEAQAFRKVGYQGLDYYQGSSDVFTCDSLTDEQRTQIVDYVSKYLGRRYSYWLIGWELLRYTLGVMLMPSKDWDPIICSTLWANAYRKTGLDLCPGIRFPTPADIAASPKLRKVGGLDE